jgi:hypothetical protein
MKKYIISIIAAGISLPAFAQLTHKSEKKNQVALDACGPVVLKADFWPDNFVIFGVGSQHHIQSHIIGLSASYSRQVKEVSIGYRFGVIFDRVNDNNETPDGSKESYIIRQNSCLNSVFLLHEEGIGKLSLRFRAELPFTWHGKRSQAYYYYVPSTQLTYDDLAVSPAGFSTGMGLGIGLTYKMNDKLSLGADFSEYFLFCRYAGTFFLTQNDSFGGSPSFNNGTQSSKNDFRKWGFSQLAPRIFLAYEF